MASAGKYFFRMYNDDDLFVFVDNDLVINHPTLHPKRIFFGSKLLADGQHFFEIFFIEDDGETSPEFTVSYDNVNFTHSSTSNSSFSAVQTPMTLSLFMLIALPNIWRFSKREP